MKYKIAICDDSDADRKYVLNMVNQWAVTAGHVIHTDTFVSAENFLFHYAEESDYDILLLDIEMGAMDGVAMAKKIRQSNDFVQIIFITGFSDYISEGYEVSALHYLMKPVKQDKLFGVLNRAVDAIKKMERVILLPVDGEILRLPIDQVQYVEAFSHTVSIVTEENTIPVKKSISEMERLLGEGFVRCHRSYLVGLKHISRLSKTEVILDNGKVLPLSRSAAAMVHKAFIFYYTGENNETV